MITSHVTFVCAGFLMAPGEEEGSSEHHAGELKVPMVALCHICVTVRKQSHDSTESQKKECDSYVLSSDV